MKRASVEVVLKLLEVGGREFVTEKDSSGGSTALYFACTNKTPIRIVSKFIHRGWGQRAHHEKIFWWIKCITYCMC